MSRQLWEVRKNTLITTFEDHKEEEEIENISEGHRYHIRILLKNGKVQMKNLQDFCAGDREDFSEKIRSSRTSFLEWLNFGKIQSNISVQSISTPCSNKDELSINKTSSLDISMIEKHRIGKHVQVHIDNLVEPDKAHLVRELNEEHIGELVLKFRQSYNSTVTLVGLVDKVIDVDLMKNAGYHPIKVLGGNHTRAALHKLGHSISHVNMDVYSEISNEQALFLAYSHNEIHENVRKYTFAERVKFFHVLYEKHRSFFPEAPRLASSSWRTEIAALNSSTKPVSNSRFKTHLSLSSLTGSQWTELEAVFDNQPEVTQYIFTDFSKVADEDREKLLHKLSTNLISCRTFRLLCQTTQVKDDDQETSIPFTEEQNKRLGKRKNNDEKVTKRRKTDEHVAEQLKQTESNNKMLEAKIKGLYAEITSIKKCIVNKDNIIANREKEYANSTKELEQRVHIATLKLSNRSKELEDYKVQNLRLKKEVQLLRDSNRQAEETAARTLKKYGDNTPKSRMVKPSTPASVSGSTMAENGNIGHDEHSQPVGQRSRESASEAIKKTEKTNIKEKTMTCDQRSRESASEAIKKTEKTNIKEKTMTCDQGLKIGEAVNVLWVNKTPHWEKWYHATILKILQKEMYKVRFTDDGVVQNVKRTEIQRL